MKNKKCILSCTFFVVVLHHLGHYAVIYHLRITGATRQFGGNLVYRTVYLLQGVEEDVSTI